MTLVRVAVRLSPDSPAAPGSLTSKLPATPHPRQSSRRTQQRRWRGRALADTGSMTCACTIRRERIAGRCDAGLHSLNSWEAEGFVPSAESVPEPFCVELVERTGSHLLPDRRIDQGLELRILPADHQPAIGRRVGRSQHAERLGVGRVCDQSGDQDIDPRAVALPVSNISSDSA